MDLVTFLLIFVVFDKFLIIGYYVPNFWKDIHIEIKLWRII